MIDYFIVLIISSERNQLLNISLIRWQIYGFDQALRNIFVVHGLIMIGAQYLTHNLFSLLRIVDLVETLIIDIVIGLNNGTRRQVWIRQLRIDEFFNRNP